MTESRKIPAAASFDDHFRQPGIFTNKIRPLLPSAPLLICPSWGADNELPTQGSLF
jgi:hypothetical protein